MSRILNSPGRWALAAVLMLLAAVGQTQDTAELPDLELVAHPDMSQVDPEVRGRLEPAYDFFRDQRTRLERGDLGLAYGRMGVNYLANGQPAAAGACLRNAMALDTTNLRWPYLLGVLYQQENEPEQAIASYSHTLDLEFSYTPALVRRAQLQLELGRLEEAAGGFAVALKRNPRDVAALTGFGDVLLQQLDYEGAAEAYERALGLDPEADYLHGQLAAAYRGLGENGKAAEEATQAGDRRPAVEDPLMAFVNAHQRGVERYLQDAATAREQNNPKAAIKLYEIATSIRPGDVETLVAMGELKALTGDPQDAMLAFGRALSIEPANARANYFAGTLFEQAGDDDQAESHYEKALEAEPQLVEPRLLLANSLMRRKKFSQAGEHYGRIAHVLPKDTEIMYLLGMAWLASGDCSWAHPVLARGLTINPADTQISIALARAYSVCADATKDQLRQALETATLFYAREPGLLSAETLAMAAAANGRFEDAVDFQAQAMFEAVKSGRRAEADWMKANMRRYQNKERALEAWNPDSEVYQPRRLEPVRTAPPAAPQG